MTHSHVLHWMTDLRQLIAELEIVDLCDFSLSQQCPSRIDRDKYKYHICIVRRFYLFIVTSVLSIGSPQPLLELPNAILLMPSLPMGDLTIAVAVPVISSFASDMLHVWTSSVLIFAGFACLLLQLGLTFARSPAPFIYLFVQSPRSGHRTMLSPAALSGAAAISSRLASATASSVSASGTVAAGSIASFSSSQSIPPPNRMTKAFHEMKQTCPQQMQAYADCVVRGHREGNLDRGACQAEFDLVKACFRSARRSGRS